MNKIIVLGIIFLTIISIFTVATLTAIPQNKPTEFRRVVRGEVKILNISDRWIEIEGLNRTGKVYTLGKWIYIKENEFKSMDWSEAKNLFSIGDTVKIVIAGFKRGNRTIPIVLKMSKDDFTLIRSRLLRYDIGKGRRLAFKATITYVGDKYLIVQRATNNIVVIVGGKWVKAGDGEVDWSEVKNEFKVGDSVWIYGKIAPFKKSVENIRAIAAPQTLINIDTGISLIRG